MGTGKRGDQVNVIDFGLAKPYRDSETGGHVAYSENRTWMAGTVPYASLNTHLGVETSRRDDQEGLGYVFVVSRVYRRLQGGRGGRRADCPVLPQRRESALEWSQGRKQGGEV